jgi:hypothetical protein
MERDHDSIVSVYNRTNDLDLLYLFFWRSGGANCLSVPSQQETGSGLVQSHGFFMGDEIDPSLARPLGQCIISEPAPFYTYCLPIPPSHFGRTAFA